MYYSLAGMSWYSSVHLAFTCTLTLSVVHHRICVYLALLTVSSTLLLTFSSDPASSSSARHPLIIRPSFLHLTLQLLLNIVNAVPPLFCQLLSPSKKSRRSSPCFFLFLARAESMRLSPQDRFWNFSPHFENFYI